MLSIEPQDDMKLILDFKFVITHLGFNGVECWDATFAAPGKQFNYAIASRTAYVVDHLDSLNKLD